MTTPEDHKAMMDGHAIAAAERVIEEAAKNDPGDTATATQDTP